MLTAARPAIPASPGGAGSRLRCPGYSCSASRRGRCCRCGNGCIGRLRSSSLSPHDSQAARDAETIWKRAGNPDVRHPVDVIRTIDGDTFEARVHLSPGLDLTTRVRLRGIDAPELKAACPQELQMAEAAGDALRGLLGEGGVTIYNIGPDKYSGRVVADVATRTDRQRLGGAARQRSCAQLSAAATATAGARTRAEALQTEKSRAACAASRFSRHRWNADRISASPPPWCRPKRAGRDR